MRELLRKHSISFKAATEGVIWSLSTQPNFRIHLVLSAVAIAGGIFFKVSRIEFIILVFTIMLGLIAEMINTAIESVTDLVTKEWRKEAKIAKDVAAGMMLVTAIGAVIVAFIIFWPYIVR